MATLTDKYSKSFGEDIVAETPTPEQYQVILNTQREEAEALAASGDPWWKSILSNPLFIPLVGAATGGFGLVGLLSGAASSAGLAGAGTALASTLGNVGSGAILGGVNAKLQGGNVLTGAITGGAGAYAGTLVSDYIAGVAGLDAKGTDAYNATLDARRVADAGGSLADVTDAVSKYGLSADKINSIISDAVTGAQTIATPLTDTLSQGAVNVTGAATTGTSVADALAAAAAASGAGLLTGGTGANNVVNVTAKTPEQLQAEALAATLAGSTVTNTGNLGANQTVNVTEKTPAQVQADALAASLAASTGNLGANQTVDVTAKKANNTLTGFTTPNAGLYTGAFTGATIPSVDVTAKKATNTVDNFVDPTTGLLTAAGLTALTLSTSGATSLNNTGADTTTGSNLTDLLTKYGPTVLGLVSSGLSTANAYKGAENLQDIFNTQATTLGTAAKAAAPGYQFSPIGMTTAFGKATPTFDANGKLISYDYAATPAVAAQRDALMKLSSQALPTTTNPTDIVNNYISQQQGLLAPGQAQDLARLQAQMAATGRSGLGTGAVAGTSISPALAATNPQLAAYYNSLAQQNQQIAANAPTYAQNLLNAQIGTSGTLFGQAQTMETAAQQPLTMGSALGEKITAGTTNASNAAYKAAQDAALLQTQGALGSLKIQTDAQNALLSQFTNATGGTGSSGLFSLLLNAGVDIAKLIPSFFSGGTTVVGNTTNANANTTGTGVTATPGGTSATSTTLPTKLLSGGTTVVNGGVNNATSVAGTPRYDSTGKLVGYDYLNTGATAGGNTGLLSATANTPTAPSVSDIYAAYMNNPKAKAANPFGPDTAAINYWQQRGLADFNQVVAGL